MTARLGAAMPRGRFVAAAALAVLTACAGLRAQSAPAPVVVTFVGLHGGAFAKFEALAADAGVACRYVDDDKVANGAAEFARADAVVLQHLRDPKELATALLAAKRLHPSLRVFALSGAAALTTHGGEALVENDAKLTAYYKAPRRENLAALLQSLRQKVRGEPDTAPEPLPLDLGVLHRPGREEPFRDVDALLADAKARGIDVDHAPRVAVAVHSTHFLLQQPRVVQALVEALDRRGALAFAAIDGGEGLDGYAYEKLMLQLKPAVVIHTCHSTEKVPFRSALDAVHLHSVFFRTQSIADWQQSPNGIAPSEIMFQVATQEMLGATTPIPTCGTVRGGGSDEDFTPIPDRIERVVGRALAEARLRTVPAADKKIAIVYYDREASRSSLMRGSPTGMMLNAPPSLLAVLRAMRDRGYRVDVPADEDTLVAMAERSGRVVGISGPGEAERLADSGLVPLVPQADYERWLAARVPPAARADLEKHWGPAPGRICVVERRGQKFVVVPMLRLGNVVLMPQPLRGEAYDPSQTHDKAIPPPHSYLAAYFWLEHTFGAHAYVHFGTHGSEFFLPGKNVGMSQLCWPDILFGDMPNVSPWVVNNTGESILSKRRAYATLVDHLVPPTQEAGLADGLAALHRDLHRMQRLEPGVLREKLRSAVTQQVRLQGMDRDLDLQLAEGALLDDGQLDLVCAQLHVIEEDLTPTTLHRLGQAPDDALRLPWLVHCGGQALLDALGEVPGLGPFAGDHERARGRDLAGELLRRHLRDQLPLDDALRACGAAAGTTAPTKLREAVDEVAAIDRGLADTRLEIDNLLRALDGRFVTPGPGQSPERNPKSVPTGRNMFLLDPRELPTKEAWQIGVQLADELLQKHKAEHGDWPTKIAFNIRAMNSFRDFGVMEAQVLWMLGCEPVRDNRGNVVDVALVPREKLGRPRIDVFLQGGSRYNDMLADRAKLLDRAVRLAIAQDEPDNRVRAATLARTAELQAAGVEAARAELLAKARMFGGPPGGANASYSYLVQRSGDWKDQKQLAEAWLAGEKYAYTDGAWGEEANLAFRSALKDSEYVLRSWADTTRGPTTDKYMWLHGGTLAMAIETLSDGRKPRFVMNDLRDMGRASLVDAEQALRRDFRVRALNRKWLEGMMKEGYAGADQLKVITSNAYGWQTMRSGAIPDSTFEQLADVYVRDSLKLGLKEFFAKENPWALQGIAENLLETARKGMWNAKPETLALLADTLQQSRAAHGDGGGFTAAGNTALEQFVQAHATATVDATAAKAAPTTSVVPATASDAAPVVAPATASGAATGTVQGIEMQAKEPAREPTPTPTPPATTAPALAWSGALVAAAAVLLLLVGFRLRLGVLR
ncbi:MAG: cobaltochelatase subunit CobN [Planctomycetes bacterium]|nr:cobaltochelatase subunit CobN [Planctomycetota bacterium]